ncbi:MAG TPA: hypothetical protein VGP70_00690 [Actinomadura sp.]|jgi:predicted ATPase|nr:hypothetical protein [Actinomadura sp.]
MRRPDAEGVWFVGLASVSDPAEVPQAVLSVLALLGVERPGPEDR